ncbi:hypothetical protein [Acidocella sp. C78]|uniref:hypothetical protein n=1 Tax=Acidocella sp. C78 TaxID=1671486 RepID=UPI00191BA134|nr:hypothetical protein [Acidocella sp. C78]
MLVEPFRTVPTAPLFVCPVVVRGVPAVDADSEDCVELELPVALGVAPIVLGEPAVAAVVPEFPYVVGATLQFVCFAIFVVL